MIAHAEGVRHGGQRRVHRADTRKEAGIDYIKVIQLMRLAVNIQHRRFGVFAEARCPRLMCDTANVDLIFHVEIARNQMVRVHAQMIEHGLQFVVKFLLGHLIVERVAQLDAAVLLQRNPIVRHRQILRR